MHTSNELPHLTQQALCAKVPLMIQKGWSLVEDITPHRIGKNSGMRYAVVALKAFGRRAPASSKVWLTT